VLFLERAYWIHVKLGLGVLLAIPVVWALLQCIAIARANATTVRSFYGQNLHGWGSSQAASN
jgi:hypothetical protein